MPNFTITGGVQCTGGGHTRIETDQGNLVVVSTELDNSPQGFDQLKEAFIIVVRHQYLTRRAAGRTHPQALSDLVGFVVRL